MMFSDVVGVANALLSLHPGAFAPLPFAAFLQKRPVPAYRVHHPRHALAMRGDAAQHWGIGGALLGVAVHLAIMAAMVAAGLWLARKTPLGAISPWKAGLLYGLALYCLMYGLVLPLRFGVPFPNPDRVKLALGLLPHIAFVGWPIFGLVRKTAPIS